MSPSMLRNLVDSLASYVATVNNEYPDIAALIPLLRNVSEYVSTKNFAQQDSFRDVGGFECVLGILRRFSGFYDPHCRTRIEMQSLFELLRLCLRLLSSTLRGSPANRRYFRCRIGGGGWEALEQIIASIGFGGAEPDPWISCHLYGTLLAFALGNESLDVLCQSLAISFLQESETDSFDAMPSSEAIQTNDFRALISATSIEHIRSSVRDKLHTKTVIFFPEILRALVSFWVSIPRPKGSSISLGSVFVLETISCTISTSISNLSAVHSAGVLSQLIRVVFGPGPSFVSPEREEILGICKKLMFLGIEPADARFLLSTPRPDATDFCLEMMSSCSAPPFFHFDLSIHGYASLELPSLGRSFPPPSGGYTFTAWIRVETFDPGSHTTLFGVFDSSQTCFVLMYIERATRNFILQTSVFSEKPSVRFESVNFCEKRWYHIAIAHRKRRATGDSRASLYVDGEFKEEVLCQYPHSPPSSNTSNEHFVPFSANHKQSYPVQAFIGTPLELSGTSGPAAVHSRWFMASAHLFDEILSCDFLAVHFGLGPRYQGNFQDCLGGFQTYEASALLGLRNELFSTNKDEGSVILRAVREKASLLLPESKILLSILPSATFSESVQYQDYGLLRALPRASFRNIFRLTEKDGKPLAINCAMSSLAEAFRRLEGTASFRGTAVAAVPCHLDENLWRLAGFTPLALKLLERATTVQETIRSIEIIFSGIRNSWRNSEAMERDRGYGILGLLLRLKLGYDITTTWDGAIIGLSISRDERDALALRILSLILEFVGFNHAAPSNSYIINPLAYRILLIDLDIWRKSASNVQELYYWQFSILAVDSKYSEFNKRRLNRMRIVKRLLDALKGEDVPEAVECHFLCAFEALVKSNMSQEVMRALSLFITFAFHSLPPSLPRGPKKMAASLRPSISSSKSTLSDAEGARSQFNESRLLRKRSLGQRILEMYSEVLCDKDNLGNIKKLARTVTNKWLLSLISDHDPAVASQGCRILARLLVAHGPSYTAKFSGKIGGFSIMAFRLKRFWRIPMVWLSCFSILFGYDIAKLRLESDFCQERLMEIFSKRKVMYSEALIIITSMLGSGLREAINDETDPKAHTTGAFGTESANKILLSDNRHRAQSLDLNRALQPQSFAGSDSEAFKFGVLQTAVDFLQALQEKSTNFADFASSSEWIRMLLWALYPAIIGTEAATPDIELNCRESAPFTGFNNESRRPDKRMSLQVPIMRSIGIDLKPSWDLNPLNRKPALHRTPSSLLLTSLNATGLSEVSNIVSSRLKSLDQGHNREVLSSTLDLVLGALVDQVTIRKDFLDLGLFNKTPPGPLEHRKLFESQILKTFLHRLSSHIHSNHLIAYEPRALSNLSKLCLRLSEAVFEGWFDGGAEIVVDFTGMMVELLHISTTAPSKSSRQSVQALATIRSCFLKTILFTLSAFDSPQTSTDDATHLMNRLAYWQTSILSSLSLDDQYLKLFWFQLYTKLIDDRQPVRVASANFFRTILVQLPEESAMIFRLNIKTDMKKLLQDFQMLTQVEDDAFLDWVDQHRPSLDELFFGSIASKWEEFVDTESDQICMVAKGRQAKRREKLKSWYDEALKTDKTLLDHQVGNSTWMKSIYNSEYFRYQRILQDKQDDSAFLAEAFRKMQGDFVMPDASSDASIALQWKLDRTEGRNRMRLRLLPIPPTADGYYRPKGKQTESAGILRRSTMTGHSNSSTVPIDAPRLQKFEDNFNGKSLYNSHRTASSPLRNDSTFSPEDDFELVDDPNDPNEGEENFEDKNRKVMRRLEPGDQVQAAYNVSRITGLEACEGLLIIAKEALYIIDNVFQCAHGDIVNAWQAPVEERDPFTLVVTGRKTLERRQSAGAQDQESRHWRWHDVISVSKRRFLFRDVAIEVFFTDGRSYLLTTKTSTVRDDLFSTMLNKAPHTSAANTLPDLEDVWRLETFQTSDEACHKFSSGLSSKIGTLFSMSPWNQMTKKWQRGEVSNFHYLMMVNTMAGRTFNDLTQYPVFPWILADYTSNDLDLEDRTTFRDLSKPMGAQTPGRITGFVETYNALREIGQTPFHYGTHYSSAMIVSSYLIRLPPFVQSYLLVQGDTFDHADRLFQSVGEAWKSASCNNKTDVRELIPEFFCLPEFLVNFNGYDFGRRQSNGAKVDHVELPPWAKGDPKIFIAKHREALESPYVSENLHQWIDLVFGYKQQGDEAVENLNVFHHLSYAGASDLDRITDANERAITAGVIHNFGQTPHQVFPKPHPARDHVRCPTRRLDTGIFSLKLLNRSFLDGRDRVASLTYSLKHDRLLCAPPLRLHFPPFEKYMEWGFADRSIRFFFGDSQKPAGLFENLHTSQVSSACFADSKTLITAGDDCVVSVHTLRSLSGRPVDLVPRSSMFGHRSPVTTIAASKTLSTLVTVSSDGQAFLWDLIQLAFIRKLPLIRPVECARINNVSGDILLCSGQSVLLYTLNGALILEQNVCLEQDDFVHSCSFYEGAGNEWVENSLIFTGHSKGRVNVWRKSILADRWTLELLRRLDHVDSKSGNGANTEAGITCITPMPTCLYTGDDEGRVYEWYFGREDKS